MPPNPPLVFLLTILTGPISCIMFVIYFIKYLHLRKAIDEYEVR
jgi:hypothetical protein